jgi:hypothetical protein
MNTKRVVAEEVPGLYRIVPLQVLRRTPHVSFDAVPASVLSAAGSIDRVLHERGAISPGPVGSVARPWYMHPYQDDNLLVLHGTRHVEIYTSAHGKIESFVVTPHTVEKDGKPLFDGPAMLVWPRYVFHRIMSDEVEGSASLNFAVHYEGFDIRTNFSIYDLNTETGEYHVIREGHLDQPDEAPR